MKQLWKDKNCKKGKVRVANFVYVFVNVNKHHIKKYALINITDRIFIVWNMNIYSMKYEYL